MTVKDPDLLDEFRRAWRCEWCHKQTPSGCDPAHVYARGLGGGSRLDVRINLVSLCRSCHQKNHAGKITRWDLWPIVARRETKRTGVYWTADTIAEEIYRLLREKK